MDTDTTSNPAPAEVAAVYVEAWKAGDEARLRSILSEDVTFVGALGTATGVDECVAGLLGMRSILTDVVVHARVADDHDVITWFDLHTSVADPAPTANWSHVEEGRITAIRVTFDPRGILAGGDGPAPTDRGRGAS